MLIVESPKVNKRTLPPLNTGQVDYLINQAVTTRDKAIIGLFADSSLRLLELASIKLENIDFQERPINTTCKGDKEGLAVFGLRIEKLLNVFSSNYTYQP